MKVCSFSVSINNSSVAKSIRSVLVRIVFSSSNLFMFSL